MKVKRRKLIHEDPEVDKDKVLMTLMYLSGGYANACKRNVYIMDLECQILQFFSLSFIIILVSFFVQRD